MRKFDLSLRSSRSSYFATFRHQLTILSKTDALDEEKWLNMLGTFVKDWFRYESHFVHGRDSLVDILKERGLLSESDAVQPLIGKDRKSGSAGMPRPPSHCNLSLHDALPIFATFRHQLTILSKTDALDEEKWLNMLGTFVKDWFRYESHFVHGRDSLVDILKERGLLSESDAVQPLIGKKS